MVELRNPIVSGNADAWRLPLAVILSTAIHAAFLGASVIEFRPSSDRKAAEPLEARLVPATLPSPPALIAPEAPQETAVTEPTKPTPKRREALPVSRSGFTATDVVRTALKQIAAQPFYPEEAIARGIEGDVLVRLFLDEAGNAIAARLEGSSGHAILDDAAVRAAGKVRALPLQASSELLLPVRFRLR